MEGRTKRWWFYPLSVTIILNSRLDTANYRIGWQKTILFFSGSQRANGKELFKAMDLALCDPGSVCQGPSSGQSVQSDSKYFINLPLHLTFTRENFGQKQIFCIFWLWHWSKSPVRCSDAWLTINLLVSISRLIYCQSRPGSHFLCRHHTTGGAWIQVAKSCTFL